MTYLEKLFHTQKHPDSRFQFQPCFESEYVEVYGGLGASAPNVTGLGE